VDDESKSPGEKSETAFSREVGAQAVRKLRARRHSAHNVWSGLGMSGLIGWSVVVPTLVGTACGVWLDKRHPGRHSWTLTLLIAGLFLGCWNAWQWVAKEEKTMREEQENHDG
jgi:ATP synthase protein I